MQFQPHQLYRAGLVCMYTSSAHTCLYCCTCDHVDRPAAINPLLTAAHAACPLPSSLFLPTCCVMVCCTGEHFRASQQGLQHCANKSNIHQPFAYVSVRILCTGHHFRRSCQECRDRTPAQRSTRRLGPRQSPHPDRPIRQNLGRVLEGPKPRGMVYGRSTLQETWRCCYGCCC